MARETEDSAGLRPGGRARAAHRHALRLGAGLGLALVLAAALGLGLLLAALLLASGRPLSAPAWVANLAEDAVEAALDGELDARLGGLELFLEEGGRPRLRFRDLDLVVPGSGRTIASLPELRLVLDRRGLVGGGLRPVSLAMPGATIRLVREEDGRFDFPPQDAAGADAFALLGLLPEFLASSDRIFGHPRLASLERVSIEAVTIVIDDRASGRSWDVSDGRLVLEQGAGEIRAGLSFGLGLDGARIEGSAASADLTYVARKDSGESRFEARFDGASVRDIAVQSPAMAWLGVLDAAASGTVRARTDAEGRLLPVEGRLDIGAGDLRPAEGARPIPFDSAAFAFVFDAQDGRFDFPEIGVESRTMRLAATGRAWVGDLAGAAPATVTAQIGLASLVLDPEGVFDAPVAFGEGMADLKLRLDPFTLTLGQAMLGTGESVVHLSGRVGGGGEGWTGAVDAALNRAGHEQILALWPRELAPRTRDWLAQNVIAGEIRDAAAAVRLRPGETPLLGLSFEFADAGLRYLRGQPPIRKAAGRAALDGRGYAMAVERGEVEAPEGGTVDAAGTVFRVADLQERPARAEIALRASGPVPAALSLLDAPPFGFLGKAGQPVDLAEGRAEVSAAITLPLLAIVPPDEIDYDVTARLLDLRSERIVPGRRLEAEELALRADPQVLSVGGAGRLDGIPFRGEWRQGLAAQERATSRVEAEVPISPEAAAVFAPGLPAGLIAGAAAGRFTADLRKDEAPRFTLQSDLRGAGLSLPPLGWEKPSAVPGRLTVEGRLGSPAAIDRLAIEAPGLSAGDGRITLRAGGGLDAARFGRVRIGGWFDAPVAIRPGEGGGSAIVLDGGTLDLRRAAGAPAGGGGADGTGARGAGLRIAAGLDSVRLTEGLALSDVRGDFSTSGGLAGGFTAAVNGGAAVQGSLAGPSGGGAIRIAAQDAGAVLRSAGLTGRGAGGTLDLTLTPRATPGEYDGRLVIRGLRLRDAPTLAGILSAISVVGLLEQLSGEGILFSDIEVEFRLTPGALEIKRAAATGPSLGVTAAGVYLFASNRMELSGVVSPIYLVNRIGSVISRPGEGLFGFTYALSGAPDAPAIRVNPLSLLTPGFLRDLFRTPVTRLAD